MTKKVFIRCDDCREDNPIKKIIEIEMEDEKVIIVVSEI